MARPCVPLEIRLWSRVQKSKGCWLWLGAHDTKGYGAIGAGGRGGKVLKVHALVYTLLVADIPQSNEIHHKCENVGCCNPDHLISLTRKEHGSIPHSNRKKPPLRKKGTHCAKGHPFDEANTYVWKGQRGCRTCNLYYTHLRRGKVNPKPCPAKQ